MAVLTVGVGLAVMPAVASATIPPPEGGGGGVKVKALKPWKQKFLYRVQRGFQPRTEQSRLAPKAGMTLAKGSWLHIDCQRYVGTELWGIVAGGWVPDAVMKTYTDGRLQGSPTCAFPHPEHVWTLQAWGAGKQYFVKVAQLPQSKPHLGNGLPTVLERGDWVTIQCQTKGQKYGGSALWDRIGNGGYIPDSTVKTLDDNRLARAPHCTKPHLPPAKFMALGDSYSSGLGGDGHFVGSALVYDYDYFKAKPPGREKECNRSPHAYSRVLGKRLKTKLVHTPRTFLACQGDVTTDVLDKQVPHILPNTRLVTLTIGGNDMGFKSILIRCAASFNCANAIQNKFGKKWEKLADLGAKLDKLYWAISQKAPFAKVVVIGYPQLFQPADEVRHCGGIGEIDARNLNLAGTMLNRTIRQAVGRHQSFRFVSMAGAFVGHGMCRDQGPSMWINPIVVTGARKNFSAHPNRRGHHEIADRVAEALPNLFR